MQPGTEPTEPVEIARAWRRHLCSGDPGRLDWLTMRTCLVDLSGAVSDVDVVSRPGVVSLAETFSLAFDEVSWDVSRIEEREHTVLVDAALEAVHAGPLDLSAFTGRTYPPTWRRLRLPTQRFACRIAHKRVQGFEVLEGPGLGWDLIVEQLELGSHPSIRLVEDADEATPAGEAAARSSGEPASTQIGVEGLGRPVRHQEPSTHEPSGPGPRGTPIAPVDGAPVRARRED